MTGRSSLPGNGAEGQTAACFTFHSVQHVLILRHGESEWNVEGRWQGWLDAPLTAEGEAQADGAGPPARPRRLPPPGALLVRPRAGGPHGRDHRRAPRRPGADPTPGSASATSASGRAAPTTRSTSAGPGCATSGGTASSPHRRAARTTPPCSRASTSRSSHALAHVGTGVLGIVTHHGVVRAVASRAGVDVHTLIPNLGGFWFDIAADGTLCNPVAVDTLPDDDERARSGVAACSCSCSCWARRAAAPRRAEPDRHERAVGDDDDHHAGTNAAPFTLTSTAFENNGADPAEVHVRTARRRSRRSRGSGVPADATSLALDRARPRRADRRRLHALGRRRPVADRGQAAAASRPARARSSRWRPPCPPPGPAHHYRFTLYALNRAAATADAIPGAAIAQDHARRHVQR